MLADLSASRSHAIDGSEFLLFDTRFVPGFGLQVNEGLTVWTKAKNYIWMNAMLLRFVELATESKLASSVIIHLECTELCESAQSQSQSRASSADDRRSRHLIHTRARRRGRSLTTVLIHTRASADGC